MNDNYTSLGCEKLQEKLNISDSGYAPEMYDAVQARLRDMELASPSLSERNKYVTKSDIEELQAELNTRCAYCETRPMEYRAFVNNLEFRMPGGWYRSDGNQGHRSRQIKQAFIDVVIDEMDFDTKGYSTLESTLKSIKKQKKMHEQYMTINHPDYTQEQFDTLKSACIDMTVQKDRMLKSILDYAFRGCTTREEVENKYEEKFLSMWELRS